MIVLAISFDGKHGLMGMHRSPRWGACGGRIFNVAMAKNGKNQTNVGITTACTAEMDVTDEYPLTLSAAMVEY